MQKNAFEANRLPTASAHEFACYMSHRFLIFDANDWIENCMTRELSGTGMSMAEGTFSACGICQKPFQFKEAAAINRDVSQDN